MLKNVFEAVVSEGVDGDFVTVNKEEYERLVRENEEFRCMLHEVRESLPKLHEAQRNIEAILTGNGGVV